MQFYNGTEMDEDGSGEPLTHAERFVLAILTCSLGAMAVLSGAWILRVLA